MPGRDKIRILLVDDQETIRRGLRMRLSLERDLDVVAEAADGNAALSLVGNAHPDVVLMDVHMPGGDGIAATEAMRSCAPDAAVVMLSLYDDQATVARALEAGARAFVAKHQADQLLLPTIRRVAGV